MDIPPSSYWTPWPGNDDPSDPAHLQPGEVWIGQWPGLGLYRQNDKLLQYQSVTFHLTNKRAILLQSTLPSTPSRTPPQESLQLDLVWVRQTEFYSGFMRSSPKVTLVLGASDISTSDPSHNRNHHRPQSWTCDICGFSNSAEGSCKLCGIRKPVSTASLDLAAEPVPVTSLGRASTTNRGSNCFSQGASCAVCTFSNHPWMQECEMCSSPLPPTDTANAPPPAPSNNIMLHGSPGLKEIYKLSFRQGGEKDGYARLKTALKDKAWERTMGHLRAASVQGISSGPGIDGVLHTLSLETQHQSQIVDNAFKDLEILMNRAGEMVSLARSLNEKLSSLPPNETEGKEATLIRTSLIQLGLQNPALTPDMVRDQKQYHLALAKELGDLLTGSNHSHRGIMSSAGRKVIGLDEVWGLWMRARGIDLLPPSALANVLDHLQSCTDDALHVTKLPSTLHIVHTSAYLPSSLLGRIGQHLDPGLPDAKYDSVNERSLDLGKFAAAENLPLGLASQLLHSVEWLGDSTNGEISIGIVRDEQAGDDGPTKWYRDLLSMWSYP